MGNNEDSVNSYLWLEWEITKILWILTWMGNNEDSVNSGLYLEWEITKIL